MSELEERIARIEGVLEQMNERFNHLDSRLQALENRINALDSKLDSHFRWTIAVIITMWVTVIAAVLFG
ncbi:TPA: hypothetical protein EYP12_07980 [Candidatus Bipolaricaulota bacterium]|nr:hypothetical protein [Candidatus Bipolaricaulota bacterium]